MRDDYLASSDRRGFILGLAGALALGPAVARARPGQLDLARPADAFQAMLRMQGRLDDRDSPWWYFGRIYGVVGDTSPRLLVRFEGLEIPRYTLSAPGVYAATGVTTSFFQDPYTKEVLTTFANPVTGATNRVTPNMIGGTADAIVFYSVEGGRPARVKPEDWTYGKAKNTWDFHGDLVWLSHDRVYPPGIPQPMGESSVGRARLADVLDTQRAFVPASFSSTYFAPWPRWMEMSGQPGHVIWHADGIKLDSIDDLPRDFRERMEKLYPERLRALPYRPA
jgi:hypothetical protein